MWGNPTLFHLGKPIEENILRKDKYKQRLLKNIEKY